MEEEYLMFIESIYDEYLQKTENRGISLGEVAYIQTLDEKGLNLLEKEILEELNKYEE